MMKQVIGVILGLVLSVVVGAARSAADPSCQYTADSLDIGTATVTIWRLPGSRSHIRIVIAGGHPNNLHTVWVDFRDRDNGDALPPDFPIGGRAVAPAFSTTAGVTSGMTLDPNAIVTNSQGNRTWNLILNYDVLAADDSPVVFGGNADIPGGLAKQGLNEVAGAWMRKYPIDPTQAPSLQLVDASDPTLPLVERSTARGLTIVRHPDFVSHGHTPGVGGVDHFGAFQGNFRCN